MVFPSFRPGYHDHRNHRIRGLDGGGKKGEAMLKLKLAKDFPRWGLYLARVEPWREQKHWAYDVLILAFIVGIFVALFLAR